MRARLATTLLLCGLLGLSTDLWAQGYGGSSGMFGNRSMGSTISPMASSFGGSSMGGFGSSGGLGGMSGFGGSSMGGFGGSSMGGLSSGFGSPSMSPFSSMGRSGSSSSFIGASGMNTGNLLGGVMAGQTGQMGRYGTTGMGSTGMYGGSSLGMSSMNRLGGSMGMGGYGSSRMGMGGYGSSMYGNRGSSGYGGYGGYGNSSAYVGVPSVANKVTIDFEIRTPAIAAVNTDLSQRLSEMPGLHSRSRMTVMVQNGTAILRGVVATDHDRNMAAKIALLEPGISSVQNELEVAAPAAANPAKSTAAP